MIRRIRVYLPFVFLFAYVFAMGVTALWIGDDMFYQYSFANGDRISSIRQVLPSQIAHWFSQNGRFIDHIIVQILLCLTGQTMFALTNAIVYVGFVILLMHACRLKMTDWRYVTLVALMSVLGFQTKFTPTCQVGYIWMFSIVLGFILLFQKFAVTASRRHLIWLAPLSVIAGWSQEALVIGVGAGLLLFAIRNFKTMTNTQWVMFFCFGAGAMLLCLSPASIHRTGSVTGSVDFLSSGVNSIVKLVFYLRISYLLIAICLYLLFTKRATFKGLVASEPYLWLIWITLLAFNLVIGVFGNRQLFGMELAALVLTVKYLRTSFHSVGITDTAVAVMLAIFISKVFFNIGFLRQDHNFCASLHQSFVNSPDGTVYLDIPARMVTFKDTYPSDVYTWHVLNTLGRRWQEEEGKALRTLPTVCCKLDTISANSIYESASGTIDVVTMPDDPRPVRIVRYMRLFAKEIQLSSSFVQDYHPVYTDNVHSVYTIYNKVPMTAVKAIICE